MTTPESMPTTQPSIKIRVASTWLLVVGVFSLMAFCSRLWAPFAGDPSFPLPLLALGIWECIAAYAVRKRRRVGALLAGSTLAISLVIGLNTDDAAAAVVVAFVVFGVPFSLVLSEWGALL
jgi:hypothetical protein